MENEYDEFLEDQNLAKRLRPHLRFDTGDRVTLRSNPEVIMVVRNLLNPILDPEDYSCQWLDAKGELQCDFFFDKLLDPVTEIKN